MPRNPDAKDELQPAPQLKPEPVSFNVNELNTEHTEEAKAWEASTAVEMSWTQIAKAEKKKRFLEALAVHCVAAKAARVAGISYTTLWKWRAADPEFAHAWQHVFESSLVPKLEEVAADRALAGKSDLLLMFLAKGHNRGRYGDQVRHAGEGGGGAIEVTFTEAPLVRPKPNDDTEG